MSQTLERALIILHSVAEQPRHIGEVASVLGVHHSTALRLLHTLRKHGFVQELPDHSYRLGSAMFRLGFQALEDIELRSLARPAMERLRRETGETVHLGALEGNQVRYVDGVESERALRVVARTGTLAPAHCTSLGKALLAQLTDEHVCRLYPTSAEPFPARTDKSITSQAKLLKELAKARVRGYAVNAGETEEDVGSVAVAFRDFAGRPAAIAVAAPTSRLSSQRVSRIGELMIETLSRTPMSPGGVQAPAD